MSGFLLDTNVLSEVAKDAPDLRVVAFLTEQEDLWLSSILIHEVEFGLRLLPHTPRRSRLSEMLSAIFEAYGDRILPLDRAGAEWSAEFRAQARLAGRPIDLGDALVAGVAKANGLTLATRNTADFAHLDLETLNPWRAS
ncbi:MAG: type II toxin-antitoxin system VapC family toxin [Chloroflexota bacterium]|nr:type II toxin-antitoxin system VapC family toxin [Chloroflexota bacterium]